MKKTDLKKLEKEELIELIIEISKLSKENKFFLEGKLSSNFNNLFNLSCKEIDKSFNSYETMSLFKARKVLIYFKKTVNNEELLLKLYMYYILSAYELEKTDWRFQENFYSSIENVFSILIETIKNNSQLKEKYISKIKEIVNISNEGWGHRERLEEMMRELK